MNVTYHRASLGNKFGDSTPSCVYNDFCLGEQNSQDIYHSKVTTAIYIIEIVSSVCCYGSETSNKKKIKK